jgi:hypothetical protein
LQDWHEIDDFGHFDMQTRHSESAPHISLPHQFYTVLDPHVTLAVSASPLSPNYRAGYRSAGFESAPRPTREDACR